MREKARRKVLCAMVRVERCPLKGSEAGAVREGGGGQLQHAG